MNVKITYLIFKKYPKYLIKEYNYIDKFRYIDNIFNINKYNIKEKISVLQTIDLKNIIKLNFSDNQNYEYDILLNNFFSNYENIKYKLKGNNDKKINIFIYKSKYNFINILIIYLYKIIFEKIKKYM